MRFGSRAGATLPPVDPEDDVITEETVLSEGVVLQEEQPVFQVLEAKDGGIFEADGTCKVAIIRPCVSRGRRIRGLPPIYTPSMLAENASVFSGWLMYADHLSEGLVKALQERGRSIRDLQGRVTESYYDPELTFADDKEYGFQKGGVVGKVKPQKLVREMLEVDPQILHVSINAYPKTVKAGEAPWKPGTKGMLIEGIRSKPPGSVDWVPRAGAGGRVLAEDEAAMVGVIEHFAVSLSGSGYDPAHATEDDLMFENLSREQLVEKLRKENPKLAQELGLAEGDTTGPTPTLTPATPAVQEQAPAALTMDQVEAKLAERDAAWEAKLEEKDESIEERAQELLQEREEARTLATKAHDVIKRSGLPSGFQQDLFRRWDVLPSGPTPALASIEPVTESDGTQLSAVQVLEKRIARDIQHAADLIAESNGGRRPHITGLGGGDAGAEGQSKAPANSAFRDFLRESGDKFGEKPEDFENGLREMVREGVSD